MSNLDVLVVLLIISLLLGIGYIAWDAVSDTEAAAASLLENNSVEIRYRLSLYAMPLIVIDKAHDTGEPYKEYSVVYEAQHGLSAAAFLTLLNRAERDNDIFILMKASQDAIADAEAA